MRRALALAFAISAAIGASARSQVVDGWGWSILIPSVGQTDALGSYMRQAEG